MNIDTLTGKLVATKSETKRFVEARIIADAINRQVSKDKPDPFWSGLANDLKRAAQEIGAKHLDPETGYLTETAKEARVTSGVPA